VQLVVAVVPQTGQPIVPANEATANIDVNIAIAAISEMIFFMMPFLS